MNRCFVYSEEFDMKWNDLGLTDNDLNELENFLLKNPQAGAVIQGTGGLRKLRWALPATSKSGGIRVLYVDIVIDEEIYMVDLFAKSKKTDLTANEKKALKQFIKNELK